MEGQASTKSDIKIGKFWFKRTIVSYFTQHPKLKQKIEKMFHLIGLNPYSNRERKFQIKFLTKILPQVTQTAHTSCQRIKPNKLVHINFTNLRFLHIKNLRIYNIECLEFINLANLEHFNFNSQYDEEQTASMRNKLRSIKPLVKCLMPKVKYIGFSSGSCKSIGKDVSRIKTSKAMKRIDVEQGELSLFREDGFLDEDMSVWVKLETKSLALIRRLQVDNQTGLRIYQRQIEQSIRRKYNKIEISCADYQGMNSSSSQSGQDINSVVEREQENEEELSLSSDEDFSEI